jgi:hypothetical protein
VGGGGGVNLLRASQPVSSSIHCTCMASETDAWLLGGYNFAELGNVLRLCNPSIRERSMMRLRMKVTCQWCCGLHLLPDNHAFHLGQVVQRLLDGAGILCNRGEINVAIMTLCLELY